ncbi:MAG: shikimate kinase [Candidatus Altiarchaeota archaeon]
MTSAICYGAGSIIAAFATGKGGAFGIDLHTKATVELNNSRRVVGRIKDNPGESARLIELCAKNTLKHFGFKHGVEVETESTIPIAGGLKSSSVAANATVLATAGALAEKHGEIREVRLSKKEKRQEIVIKNRVIEPLELINIGVDSALQAKVTVTGAFDDATASYLGGYTITDNKERKILRMGDVESMNAVILIPDKKIYTAKADLKRIPLIKNSVQAAWELALKGEVYTAITLNGLLHSLAFNQNPETQLKALEAGALAAGLSGKGPSVIALTRGSTEKIKKAWSQMEGTIVETKTNNTQAHVLK